MTGAAIQQSQETPALAAIAIWPLEVLACHLVSADPMARTLALGMALQPGAPVGGCVDALTRATELSLGDALALQLAAASLGCLPPGRASPAVYACLAALVSAQHGMPIRIAAAHAMFRLHCLPASAIDSVCLMLFDVDPSARKVANSLRWSLVLE